MTLEASLYVLAPFVLLAVCYGMVRFYERDGRR